MFDTVPIGLIIITLGAAAIFLGVGQRALDRMRLTDVQALAILAVMFAGAFLPEVRLGAAVSVNLGGAVVPLGIAVYLIARAGTTMEKWRAIAASLVTAAAIYAADKLIPPDPGPARFPVPLDATLVPGVLGGLVAYLFGRSRRSAFIAGTLGVILADLIVVIENAARRIPGAFNAIGGAGVFDASIVAGFLAVFLAEVIGETREALQGGPSRDRPEGLLRGLRGRVRVGAEGGETPEGEPAARGERPAGDAGGAAGGGLAALLVPVVLAGFVAAGAGVLGSRLNAADEVLRGPLFTVRDEAGRLVFQSARRVHPGDRYIDRDNRRYRIERVNGRRATARFLGFEPMPDVAALPGSLTASRGFAGPAVLAVPARRDLRIGIYHTHNDESYVRNQGTSAVEGRGGIHEVGDAFAAALRKKGYRVIHDETINLPHDNGAYRRSRRVASRMLRREGADLLFDVHRDAGPPSLYAEKVDGKWVTQVRLVVGSPSPNQAAVMSWAKEIKAVADREHPGLIKGIFVGRDAYNQDLSPRALLIEVGTEQNAMQSAERGATLFADVIDKWLATRGRK